MEKQSNVFSKEVLWIKHRVDLISNFSHGGFNQDVAKKCGSKWELGKMDRALIRMWQKRVGLNGNLAKVLGS